MQYVIDAAVAFDTLFSVVLVSVGVVGVRAVLPHVQEFKQFTAMFGVGKKK
jgi:hypothetical protein